MKLAIPYGHTRQELTLPEGVQLDILEPKCGRALRDPCGAIRNALRQPIGTLPFRQVVRPGERVAILVNDITRLVRTDLFLPILVDELNTAGIPDRDILVVFALGNHRKQTQEEQRSIVGDEMARRLKFRDHDCQDAANLVRIGRTRRGNEVWVNRAVRECDRVILTGEIIYHLIAGYSGGRKSLFPGVAGAEFIRFNHSFILDPACRIGVLEGNPAHEDLLDACHLFSPDFLLNVILSPAGELLHIVAGHYDEAHRAGCKLVGKIYSAAASTAYDVVIASAGGFPFDINLRQAHKGMENAARVLRSGGCLLYFAKCRDGWGSAALKDWAGRFLSVDEMEEALRRNFIVGAHKAYWLARLSERIRVFLVSDLDAAVVRNCRLEPVENIKACLKSLLENAGEPARIAYMPCAGFTLPVTGERIEPHEASVSGPRNVRKEAI